ncbi:MAG: polysaccharide deacetylase family protein [Boseongicola sp.]
MTNLVIKADDLRAEVAESWWNFLRVCVDQDIPASLGFISGKVQAESTDQSLVQLLHQGQFEIWNHGASHSRDEHAGTTEFFGRALEDQVTAIRTCQNACEKLFGHRPSLFGPPFNLFDCNTLRALNEFPEISCLFDIPYLPNRKSIPKAYFVECEGPANLRVFEYNKAIKDSEKYLVHRVPFVLQIHPGNHWTDDCLVRFVTFVRVVQASGYRIVLANDF